MLILSSLLEALEFELPSSWLFFLLSSKNSNSRTFSSMIYFFGPPLFGSNTRDSIGPLTLMREPLWQYFAIASARLRQATHGMKSATSSQSLSFLKRRLIANVKCRHELPCVEVWSSGSLVRRPIRCALFVAISPYLKWVGKYVVSCFTIIYQW